MNIGGMIHIDGDFHTDTCGPCEFHCWPSCHPAQVGPESVFGCTHRAWPQNRAGDFVPIVGCGGDKSICEIPRNQLIKMNAGAHCRLRSLKAKIEATSADIAWYDTALAAAKKSEVLP